MRFNSLKILGFLSIIILLSSCVTTPKVPAKPPITVEGTLFYPDESNETYIVPKGAEIIGAGGQNCKFIVENGGRMTAHSGTNNTYVVKAGGAFKGFDHPANNCKVRCHAGSSVQPLKAGEGVEFLKVE